MILCFAALFCAGWDLGADSPERVQCVADNATLKANAEAQTKSNEVLLEIQKRITTVQMDVSKRCADLGGIPIYANQNVDCKAAPK